MCAPRRVTVRPPGPLIRTGWTGGLAHPLWSGRSHVVGIVRGGITGEVSEFLNWLVGVVTVWAHRAAHRAQLGAENPLLGGIELIWLPGPACCAGFAVFKGPRLIALLCGRGVGHTWHSALVG